mmetsp:Transcript_26846/g.68871  ORF Transcript_26846/g.68871 Transcript_26846/m.68871 type:complete len:379 (+) Transcript_26846:215-1351(+)
MLSMASPLRESPTLKLCPLHQKEASFSAPMLSQTRSLSTLVTSPATTLPMNSSPKGVAPLCTQPSAGRNTAASIPSWRRDFAFAFAFAAPGEATAAPPEACGRGLGARAPPWAAPGAAAAAPPEACRRGLALAFAVPGATAAAAVPPGACGRGLALALAMDLAWATALAFCVFGSEPTRCTRVCMVTLHSTTFFSTFTEAIWRFRSSSPTLKRPSFALKVPSPTKPMSAHTRVFSTFVTLPETFNPTSASAKGRPASCFQPPAGRVSTAAAHSCFRFNFSSSCCFAYATCSFLMMPMNHAVAFRMLPCFAILATNFSADLCLTNRGSSCNIFKASLPMPPAPPNWTSFSNAAVSSCRSVSLIRSSRRMLSNFPFSHSR